MYKLGAFAKRMGENLVIALAGLLLIYVVLNGLQWFANL